MAVYKIFPEKSATLYSYYPTLNSGIDEILDVSTYYSFDGTNEVSRPLIKFPSDQISDIITNKISGSSFDAYLKLYLANASEIPLNYTIFTHPLSKNWNMGTGRLANSPITTDGVSWQYTDQSGSTVWTNGTFTSGTTGSYYVSGIIGGGTWYTSSTYQSTQSFTNISSKDIELKVTNTVLAWNSSSIANYGFILKHSSSLEFTTASKFELKYFSGNTHTIYPPALEFRWNDSVYNTGSLTVVTSSLFALTLGNNKGEFQQDSIQRFRVNVRDQYPSVVFRTSISFANSKALPSSSYWSIKDLDTEEIVVDYDTSYTKLSCDSNGNYFDIYMNGLEPERYYRLLIKTIIGGKETIVSDKDYIFKVIR
jgi:hypothetical protein